ncbi:MAG: hypothetical protein GY927_17565 [bacterium]|nr:hypothetical protein [bacterium]
MHILLGIPGVIGGVAMLLWRIKMASDAAIELLPPFMRHFRNTPIQLPNAASAY